MTQRDRAAASLWRDNAFVLLWSGQALSMLGGSISAFTWPLLALAVTGSAAGAGIVGAARTVPFFLFSVIAGVVIDRYDVRLLMVVSDCIRFVVFGSVALAIATGRFTTELLYAAAFIDGTCEVFFYNAQTVAVTHLVGGERLTHANSANAAAESGARILGPMIAGMLIASRPGIVAGAALTFASDAATFAVSVGTLVLIRRPFSATEAKEAREEVRSAIAEGFAFIMRSPTLRRLAACIATAYVAYATVPLAVLVLAQGAFHADAARLGTMFAVGGAGGLLGSLLLAGAARHVNLLRVVIAAALGWSVTVVAMSVVPNFFVLVTAWGVNVFLVGIFNVTHVTYRIGLIPAPLQGRVNSTFRLIILGPLGAGSAAGGVLISTFGPRVAIVAAGAVMLAAAAWLALSLRRVPRPHEETAG